LDVKLVIYISGGELQDFPDSHAASCHQFQDGPVSHLHRSEDDFINFILLDNVPAIGFTGPLEPPQPGGITGVLNGRIGIGLHEIKERLEVGVTAVFGLLFSALCDFAQERQNFVGCDAGTISILAKVTRKLVEGPAVKLNGIFSPNSSCGTLYRPCLPVRFPWLASCLGYGLAPNR
jgi:hypothetical protein